MFGKAKKQEPCDCSNWSTNNTAELASQNLLGLNELAGQLENQASWGFCNEGVRIRRIEAQ
jgi:hypothetical protein